MAHMTVKEFATARGRTTQGVYQLIRRHQKEMKRHIRTKDGVMVIDEEGQELLDQWNGRPQQATTAIIETEPLRDLEEANKKILRLTEEKADLQAEIIRLQRSLRMIFDPENKSSLLEIAMDNGYFDHAHMNRAYNRYLNCSSGALRRSGFSIIDYNKVESLI